MADERTDEQQAVLIARTGGDRSFDKLVRTLHHAGFDAANYAGSRPGGESGSLPSGVKVAWVVQTADDNPIDVGAVVDWFNEKLGSSQVGMLVEEAVPPEAERRGVRKVRYTVGHADRAAEDLLTRLPFMGLSARSGVFRRLRAAQDDGLGNNFLAPAMMMVIAVLAALVTAVAAASGPRTAATSPVSGLSSVLAVIPDDPFLLVDQAPPVGGALAPAPTVPPAGPQVTNEQASPEVTSQQPATVPSVPALSSTFGVSAPSTCRVSLVKGVELPNQTVCSNGGVMVLAGAPGPWHNEVGTIAISEGVVGAVQYEWSGSVVPLLTGVTTLNADSSAYGLNYIELTFTADGQHAHLIQTPSRGTMEATFSFVVMP